MVAQVRTVADEVSVTSVNQDRNFGQNFWHQAVERTHPIALEQEIPVDIKVATVVCHGLNTKSVLDFRLVEIFRNPAERRVAEVARILALATNIVDILASLLVWADD